MPTPITVPRLGWSMEEGNFSGWLKRDGERVEAGELLYALESEKATQEIESMDAGFLRILPDGPKPGSVVRVGQTLGYLAAVGEVVSFESERGRPDSSRSIPPAPMGKGAPTVAAPSGLAMDSEPRSREEQQVPRISPRALRVASELGVEWMTVIGTGRGGRIREQDVRSAATALAGVPGAVSKPGSTGAGSLSGTRRTIAERMLSSQRNTASVTLNTTADATRLVEWRQRLKASTAGASGTVPSYTDILVQLVARALSEHPSLNARWEGETLVVSSAIHIGLAVDVESGLRVPVIRDVSSLTLDQIAAQSRDLAARARAHKLTSEELRGGTFSVTNLGAFGIDAFNPIINYPECAILGLGRIRRMPAVVDDLIVPRDVISLSLTFDHRVLDGAPAARFLQALGGLIEQAAL